MKTPKGHKVVTVERQGGYAARCTVVVDGVETLCDATFACDTRTEAREAIRHEDAPGAALTATEGEDQNPIVQKEEPTVNTILADTPAVHQSIRGWAADYAAELRALMEAAPASEAYAAFCASRTLDPSQTLSRLIWAEHEAHDAAQKVQALPVWPEWVVNVDVGMIVGGEIAITASGIEHSADDGLGARVSGVVWVMILPEVNHSDDDPDAWTEVGDHDLGSTLEIGWDGPTSNDGSSAERINDLGWALIQASKQLAAIEAGVA